MILTGAVPRSKRYRSDAPFLPLIRGFSVAFFGFLLSSVFFTGFTNTSGAAQTSDHILKLQARGSLDASLRHFLTSNLKRVDRERTQHIVIDVQSSSGRIDYALDVVKHMENQEIPVSLYVTGDLKGAAILLCFAADYLFLHPNTHIQPGTLGDEGSGGALFQTGSIRKLTDRVASFAEQNGYSSALVRGMIDPGHTIHQIQVGGDTRYATGETHDRLRQKRTVRIEQTISSPGEPLSLSAEEAQKAGMSTNTVSNLPELLGTLNQRGIIQSLNVQVRTGRPGFVHELFRFGTQPVLFGLFLVLGTAAALMEVRRPGWGWGGASAAVLLGIPIYSFAFLELAQPPAVILFLSGLCLLALRSLVIPGGYVAATCSLVFMLFAFILSPHLGSYSDLTSTPWQLYYLFNSISTGLLSFGLGIVLFGSTITLKPGWFR